MELAYIWAQDNNGYIGKNGTLPWHLPDDLAYFKKMTNFRPIIMGKKTFLSLPKILPNRMHVVLTHDEHLAQKYANHDQVLVFLNERKLNQWLNETDGIGFVIGGASLFALLANRVKWLYKTQIFANIGGDVMMPAIDFTKFSLIAHQTGKLDEKNVYPHEFQVYRRKEG